MRILLCGLVPGVLLLVYLRQAPGQTLVDLRTQSKSVDFSAAVFTKPVKTGTLLPPACSVGEVFFRTDVTPGANLNVCTADNVWTPIDTSNLPPPGLPLQVLGIGAGGTASYLSLGIGLTADANGISIDDAVMPFYHSGAGLPALPCLPGRDFYTNTTAGALYFCSGVNTWQQLANTGPPIFASAPAPGRERTVTVAEGFRRRSARESLKGF